MKDFFLLSNIKCGKAVKICALNIADYKTKTRLYELGFALGTEISLLKKSLLGKTFLIKISNCEFVIRKEVASKIMVRE